MVKLIKFVIISVFQLVFVNCDRPQNENNTAETHRNDFCL
jgi:hypothetical protein